MPTIKWLAIFFQKYFNFQGFYIVYIIIWRFLGWKNFTLSKLGETRLQKMQNDESFLGEKHGKIAHWAKIRPWNYPWQGIKGDDKTKFFRLIQDWQYQKHGGTQAK